MISFSLFHFVKKIMKWGVIRWSYCWSISTLATLPLHSIMCSYVIQWYFIRLWYINGMNWFQCNDIYWTDCFEFSVNLLCISLQRVAGYSQRNEPWALHTLHSYSSCTIFAMYIKASGMITASDWILLKITIYKSNRLRDQWEQPLDILLTHNNNLRLPLEIKNTYFTVVQFVLFQFFSAHFIVPLQGQNSVGSRFLRWILMQLLRHKSLLTS